MPAAMTSDPLILAVWRQEAALVAAAILAGAQKGDAARARKVLCACEQISSRMVQERQSLCHNLAKSGVSVQPLDGPEDRAALQYHLTRLRIARHALPEVIKSASADGYRLPFKASASQVEALSHYVPDLSLVRGDDASMRITLQMTGQREALGALRPNVSDIAAVDLPSPLLRAYPAVRLVRVIANRLTGRRAPSADSDSLGTPQSLIGGLLDLARPGRNDVLVDLGCGDGRILAAAVERFGCRAIGVEANRTLVASARRRIEDLGAKAASRVEIRHGYAESAELTPATIVFLFLPVFLLRRLLPIIRSRVRPGTLIVAHEQSFLKGVPAPQSSNLVVSEDALTVASIWRAE